tara:strand:- start:543 stop:1856 length:1314 start_codon:yes stop_codon:yes gene_type:complete
MLPFKIFLFFIRCLILSLFQKKYKIIIRPLITLTNFSNNGLPNNVLMPLTHLKNTFRFLINSESHPKKEFIKETPIVLFNDAGDTNHLRAINYLKALSQKAPEISFSRSELYIKSPLIRLNIFFISILLFLMIFPICFFLKKNRGTVSIIIQNFCDWVFLSYNLNKAKCTYMYYFASYASDSNLLTFFLQKNNIIVHKVPYNVPLKFFYEYLHCDIFSTTTPFHITEILTLKYNWSVNKILNWPLLHYQECTPYLNQKKSNYNYSLGLISSGTNWRYRANHERKEETQNSEHKLIVWLNNYIKKHKDVNLIIFLHPFEKINKNIYNRCLKYYRKQFDNDNITFGEINKNTIEYFSQTKLCIAAQSQLTITRLYCGYKTIIAPLYQNNIFFQEKDIESITCYSADDLNKMIPKSLKLSDKKFFDKHNLHKYHFNHQNF